MLPRLFPFSHATAPMLLMLPLRHGNGTVVALAEILTFVETSLSTNFLAPLISLVVLLSAASPSLNLILRFLLSHAELQLRDRDAHAPTQQTQLPRSFSSSVVAPELTMESVETSSFLLILAFAQPIPPTAHAAFLRPLLTPNSLVRLAWLRATAPYPSSATAAP